ncbi:aldehyde dehydrogenase [Pseudomonas saudimassiliensis]|uniref:Aldehyde dehydrogenase n=1 Tax=Pseudomonas saudimassiliensis TaxID=1461581 RepID=A0A078MDN0_9PSED|nr:coniferyl aldehyde dehydrogenase [Pseudomonas saudimassiliensis]CEA02811.1 aldehyde dehydrogenase [Pseudomonas saudimassiliensis]CEF25953.1 aldehyde dehydrogenase [Pseudomonas saudimassiliensis]
MADGTSPYSPLDTQLAELLHCQRLAFQAAPMPALESRLDLLKRLRAALVAEQEALIDAVSRDFGNRSRDETLFAELLPSLQSIDHVSKHLRRWMKPSRRPLGIAFQPGSAQVLYQPLGVVGVIVPWNYPIFLAMGPLIGALAAGNRVMIKMSESTPATSQLVKALLARTFPQDQVAVVLGEAEVGAAFSRLPFDHLLFTGATSIGRHILHAAADNLTPVTLELGGKSPAIVSATVPLDDAAERIAFGKTMNAGQTCVAPDYVLVPESRLDDFVAAYRRVINRFYPPAPANPDYTSIINPRQLARLQHYIEDAQAKGARVIPLLAEGQDRRLPPTLLLDVTDDMLVMQDEIFGPLLPVVPYRDIDEAIAQVNARPRPLALYYFGYDRVEQQQVLERTHSGGAGINETLLHVAVCDLPFGGIGPSGMGHYHGHEGFLTFSKAKPVLRKPRFNATRVLYPPYGTGLQKLLRKLLIR